MNTIPAQEIKRRGISAVDDMLKEGPVQVIKNNRPRYVVLSTETYESLTVGRSAWDWLDRSSIGTRTKGVIDEDLKRERDGWDMPE